MARLLDAAPLNVYAWTLLMNDVLTGAACFSATFLALLPLI